MSDDANLRWATFIVRLHAEGEDGAWHGEVIHVQTRAVQQFVSLAQCEAFMQEFAPGLSVRLTSPLNGLST